MLLRTFLAPSFVAAVMWTIWAQAAEPITVLAPFNLTGPQAVLGAPCYKGAQLAVEKLNAAGGVLGRPIELIPIDTASEVSRTTNELESALSGIRTLQPASVTRIPPMLLSRGGYFKRPESPSSRRALPRDIPNKVGSGMFLTAYGDNVRPLPWPSMHGANSKSDM